jgi:hypothetical protein
MPAPVSAYLSSLYRELRSGRAREHSYRPALKALVESLHPDVHAINEPSREACGAPDFVLSRRGVPVAYIEAKDLGTNLDEVERSEQLRRYAALGSVVLTDYLEFRFLRGGERVALVRIGRIEGDRIVPSDGQVTAFAGLLAEWVTSPGITIRSAKELATLMAGKAKLLAGVVREALAVGGAEQGDLGGQFTAFRTVLLHDLTPEGFADLYAQTIVYGLFVARFHDPSPEDFSRAEAAALVPRSNPFLRKLFSHVAGPDLDRRVDWIVDALADVFAHCDVEALFAPSPADLQRFVKDVAGPLLPSIQNGELTLGQADDAATALAQDRPDTWHRRLPRIVQDDPVIHFYETFLAAYDPKLRKSRGVYYTPRPVVSYIVRSIDHLLRSHFRLGDGLADTSKTTIEYYGQDARGKAGDVRKKVHRVQLLDPACGTGTFLHEVIRHLAAGFKDQKGMWPGYVREHLLPRLHGFELMVAPYTMAHLKLGLTLRQTGYRDDGETRLGVYLSNALEEADDYSGTLFMAQWLAEEARAANAVKRDLPIMVVLGNPPYSVSSQNASVEVGTDGKKRKTWIGTLLDDYKQGLGEKKLNLDDDYIKFIRFAHHLVEKNGQGVVAMITNNSFLDGITHRRMRERLLQTFDHVYVLDLHGSSKRKEKSPDGTKDENVFDIQQGVVIALLVKTAPGRTSGRVHHHDLHGTRAAKYEWLEAHDFANTPWQTLNAPAPSFFFVPKDLGLQVEYDGGLRICDLFPVWNSGVKTDRDSLFIGFEREELAGRIECLLSGRYDEAFRTTYRVEDSGSYKLTRLLPGAAFREEALRPLLYRPFDQRWIYYDPSIISRPAYPVMRHIIGGPNVALIGIRQARNDLPSACFVSDQIVGKDAVTSLDICSVFPLYLYPESSTVEGHRRTANLNLDLLRPALERLGVTWVPDGEGDGTTTCGPEDVLHYVYAVLHSPAYRLRYRELLKIDFPRVPFASDPAVFWQSVRIGKQLVALHLLAHPLLSRLRTRYPIPGENVVENLRYEPQTQRVYVNEFQYVEGVPEDIWSFPIGGYLPLQKWLKDRKGRALNSDDLYHYQRVVVALSETKRLTVEIDGLLTFPLV